MRYALLSLLLSSCRHTQPNAPPAAAPEPARESAEPAPAPVLDWEGFRLESWKEDRDGDGRPELLVEGELRGSGGVLFRECVRRGSDGQEACWEAEHTVYSRFSRYRTFAIGEPPGVGALSLLQPLACAQADRQSPAQGSFWLLEEPEGIARDPRWLPGPPVAQEGVCLSIEAAERMSGGDDWYGAATGGEGWTAAWWPAQVDHDRPDIQPQAIESSLKRAIQTDAVEIWYQGHAVAAYDRRRDRHAWLANVEDRGQGSWKVDRWPIIAGLRLSHGTLVIELVGEEEADEPRRQLELPLPR